MVVDRSSCGLLLHPFLSYTVQAPADTHPAGNQSDNVSIAVADTSIETRLLTTVDVGTVVIQCLTVDQVEDITGDHRGHRDRTPDVRVSRVQNIENSRVLPIDAHTTWAKGIGDKCWIHAKKSTVS